MKQLDEPCKTLIEKGKCLGCNQLENPNFTGDKNCKWQPKAEDSIEQIKLILGGKR